MAYISWVNGVNLVFHDFFIVNILNINMKVFKIIYILCILPASIYY